MTLIRETTCCTRIPTAAKRPVTAEAWVQFQTIPCGMRGVRSVVGTGFSSITSSFPSHHYSTEAPS
jgi:hypothetical protein